MIIFIIICFYYDYFIIYERVVHGRGVLPIHSRGHKQYTGGVYSLLIVVAANLYIYLYIFYIYITYICIIYIII